MAQWFRAHLMFCEGPHDAAFLNKLLKTQLSFKKVELKLSELPYPISNVLQQSFKTRAADDLRLDLAKKFFLPDYILGRDEVLVMIFNYGGSNRKANMSPFLEKVFALLDTPTTFVRAGQSANRAILSYIVFADADARGLIGARHDISADLAMIGDSQWLSNSWQAIPDTTAVMQDSPFGTTAAYIWKKSAEDSGTLEDVVHECRSGHAGLNQTLDFLDARFSWSPPADATPEQSCAIAAKRLKAAFCVEGQREKPGMSLGVVLDQTDLLEQEGVTGSPAVQDCLAFLGAWLKPMQATAVVAKDATGTADMPLEAG
ncbi:hypothetical protein [Burkholderia sp. SRS-25]|uniref:hypothetical protein n=1 Tax=Burkholderia sp. SRS-25 TaxID=2094190 RepID=UPI001053E8DE|nr:hypothetical protein [Burkholderia sp. SRS-25]